jgi:hypothetical protein
MSLKKFLQEKILHGLQTGDIWYLALVGVYAWQVKMVEV